MTQYLTDNEKAECQKVMNAIIDMWLSKIAERMLRGKTFEEAFKLVREELLNA